MTGQEKVDLIIQVTA